VLACGIHAHRIYQQTNRVQRFPEIANSLRIILQARHFLLASPSAIA
jgi:hypothetical protein